MLYKNFTIITIFSINVIVSSVTVFAGVLFVHQPGANNALGASVTQVNHVNHSVHTLSTFIIIIIIIINIDADVSPAVTSTRTQSILKQN